MVKHLVFICLILSFAARSNEQLATNAITEPSILDLVKSIKKYHPKLMEVAAKKRQAELEEMKAQGAFDLQLFQETQLRPSGYYDGQYLEQKAQKQLPMMNAKVFGGYRISDGDFPGYDGDMTTLSGGEANIGIAFSLLRDRDTDSYRTALQNALEEKSNWQARQELEINALLYKGIKAYLDWFEANLELGIIQDLVKNTEARKDGIKKRVINGDLAQITLTEFNATLLSRRLSLQVTEQKREMAATSLAFYWRGTNGEMMERSRLPKINRNIIWPYALNENNVVTLNKELRHHPVLKTLDAKRKQINNNVKLKSNQLLPQADLELKVARDIGSGSETLQGTEGKIGFKFSIPLERRKAKAEHFQAKEKLKEIDYVISYQQDELQRNLDLALTSVKFVKERLYLSGQQKDLAEELLKQEMTRFKAGASDLFLLNNRETLAIQSKLSYIKSQIQLYKMELKVWAESGSLDKVLL